MALPPARILLAGSALLLACGHKDVASSLPPAGRAGASSATFEVGREATSAEIEAWSTEAMPDGSGLPEGRGTPAEGALVYAAQCAGCHGPNGEGASALPLVGGGVRVPGHRIGRHVPGEPPSTWVDFYPYATTLFDYTRRAMPWNAPGTLDADETYAVVAWMLQRNGLLGARAVLDRASLPRVVMPARAHFAFEEGDVAPAP